MFYKNFIIHHYKQIESSNSLAFSLAKSHQVNHNHIILTDSQSSGKGRMGRVWDSKVGNLYFSLVLKPQTSIAKSSQISFIAAVAMGLAIAEFSKIQSEKISHKWPNDILISGKKVAGILLESDFEPSNKSDVNFVILGIGVNVKTSPEDTIYPTTNLLSEKFNIENNQILLEKFLDNFSVIYQKWQDYGFLPIQNLWLSKAHNLGGEITVNLPEKSLKGIFKDLDKDGNLILESNGNNQIISSAEIF
jgi:BirA family biotin operon repressor/biotin-[acetyl-CoA-carboxylase] ligase